MTNTNFKELPQDVQDKAINTLKAFDEVNVIFEYGEYHVSTGIALKKEYAPDHKYIGRYFAKDIFSPEDRIVNYIEQFHSYPIEYKGAKNWDMLHEMDGLRKRGKQAIIKLVDGNAVIDKVIDVNRQPGGQKA